MKFIKIPLKIAAVFFILFLLAYAGIAMYVSQKGKAIVLDQVSKSLNRKVSVDSVKLMPLFNLEVKGLDIEGIGKAEIITVTPSILSFFTKSVYLSEIKIKDVKLFCEIKALPLPAPSGPDAAAPVIEEQKKPEPVKINAPSSLTMPVVVKHLSVRSGSLIFVDKAVSAEGVRLLVDNLKADLENVSLPAVSAITNFSVKASLPWQKEKKSGAVQIDGWVNLVKKDIQATVELADIDAIALYPYYSGWLNLEKTRINSANLSFTSKIQGNNNDVVANNRLKLKDIMFKPREENEPPERAEKIANLVIGMFQAMDGGDIVLDFVVKTKLDDFKFNASNIRMAFEEKIKKGRDAAGIKPEDVITLPGKLIEGTVKGATDITKGVINSTFSVGKELKGALESSFKKEGPEQPAVEVPNVDVNVTPKEPVAPLEQK